jgi:protein involved in polysaccharide export with SLBB domain
MSVRMACTWIMVSCVAASLGCKTASQDSAAGHPEQNAAVKLRTVENPAYVISVGDELEVKFPYHPDFNERMDVRPDGAVSLPLLQDVKAAGKTPAALAAELKGAYSAELKEPEITVIVRRFANQVVYVTGEVRNPQLVTLIGPTTLLQAVIRTGDVIGTAKDSNVLIIRAVPGQSPTVLVADLRRIRNGRETDVMLQPYDVVYVPRTAIANAGQFVENYINRIIPRSLTFPFTYEIHSDVDFPR